MCKIINRFDINDAYMNIDTDTDTDTDTDINTKLETCDTHNSSSITTKTHDINLYNMNEIYRLMSRDINLTINNKFSDCISAAKNIPQNTSNIIVYSGLCKTKQIINDLLLNKINYVIAYNTREITILETKAINYLLKIKINDTDIGIDTNNLKKIYMGHMSHMAQGAYINISKKQLINEMLLNENKRLAPNSYEIYRLMSTYVTNILNILIRNNVKLKYVVLDIFDEYNNQDNLNQSNVMFKMSIFNYIVNHEIYDCSVY